MEYLHTDALGSVRMVTDESGGVVSRHDYYPFGGEIGPGVNGRSGIPGYAPAESGDPRARERFTGKERDEESGLDYFGARYYAGAQGRFTSVDPGGVGASVGQPQSWNAYSYGLNNPLRFNDPNGRAPKDVVVGGKNFVVNSFRGVTALIENVALDVFMPSASGSRTGGALWAPVGAAIEDYGAEGVSGVGTQLLNQGEAGATEIVTEAILTGGLGAQGAISSGAVGAAAGAIERGANVAAFGPSGGRVFWSGGSAAEAAATGSGLGRTIAQTPAGAALATAEKALSLSYSTTQPLWSRLSASFARGASGDTHAFVNSPRPTSIYLTTERPLLLRNPAVTLIEHEVSR